MGGVRQAAVRRPRAGSQIPGPLHAPSGHLEPATAVRGRPHSVVSLERLRGRQFREGDDARWCRVPAPFFAACLAQWLRPHPALRFARQSASGGEASPLSVAVERIDSGGLNGVIAGGRSRGCEARGGHALPGVWERTHGHHRDASSNLSHIAFARRGSYRYVVAWLHLAEPKPGEGTSLCRGTWIVHPVMESTVVADG